MQFLNGKNVNVFVVVLLLFFFYNKQVSEYLFTVMFLNSTKYNILALETIGLTGKCQLGQFF